MIKLFELLKRRSDMTQEEFLRYWREVHGPLALKNVPYLRRYVQNHPVDLRGRGPAFDGIAELWFDDMESFRKMNEWYRSEEGRSHREDEDRFIGHIVGVIADEMVMR